MLLDTRAVIWLHIRETWRFSKRALAAIDANDLAVSPMVERELAYLHEIGGTAGSASEVLAALGARIGLTVSQIGFGPVCATAAELTWTRDPFDRLIAAHALTAGLPLLAKDRTMRENLPSAFWD